MYRARKSTSCTRRTENTRHCNPQGIRFVLHVHLLSSSQHVEQQYAIRVRGHASFASDCAMAVGAGSGAGVVNSSAAGSSPHASIGSLGASERLMTFRIEDDIRGVLVFDGKKALT